MSRSGRVGQCGTPAARRRRIAGVGWSRLDRRRIATAAPSSRPGRAAWTVPTGLSRETSLSGALASSPTDGGDRTMRS